MRWHTGGTLNPLSFWRRSLVMPGLGVLLGAGRCDGEEPAAAQGVHVVRVHVDPRAIAALCRR